MLTGIIGNKDKNVANKFIQCPANFGEDVCFIVNSNRDHPTWFVVVSNTKKARYDDKLPRVNRSEASKLCNDIGANLTTILSKEEDEIIANEVNRQFKNVKLGLNKVWISLEKTGKKKQH